MESQRQQWGNTESNCKGAKTTSGSGGAKGRDWGWYSLVAWRWGGEWVLLLAPHGGCYEAGSGRAGTPGNWNQLLVQEQGLLLWQH